MKKILLSIAGVVLLLIVWAALVFFATAQGWFRTPITKDTTPQAYANAATPEFNNTFVGSLAMATLSNGVVEDERFHTTGKPVDRNTVFQVASLSKWISAFGIMTLVETGKLALDTPVNKYLTRWHLPPSTFNTNGVTVRRLLSHTAGLTDGLGYSGFETDSSIQSLEASLTHADDADAGISGAVAVGLEPGSTFKYSGGGYTLLQLLVEETSGQSFNTYMKETVFNPLKMMHTTYIWQPDSAAALTDFYNADGTPAKHYRYTALAAASLHTSLSDLELFFQAHLPGKNNEPIGRGVLKPQTLKMMREPHARQMGLDIWGLGTVLFAPTENHDFIIGHDGKSTPPINTAVRLNPETGDGVIILETGHPSLATRLASEWVFWKTGQIDIFLFPTLVGGMFKIIITGWIVIVVLSAILAVVRRRARQQNAR